MKHHLLATRSGLRRTLVAAALAAAYSSSWSLETFTLNPGAVGLVGSSVTADNILLSDFFTATVTGATTFSETGFLSITGFQLGGTNVTAGGLNSTYSLYFRFDGTGHSTTGTNASDPRTTLTAGAFDTLTYS